MFLYTKCVNMCSYVLQIVLYTKASIATFADTTKGHHYWKQKTKPEVQSNQQYFGGNLVFYWFVKVHLWLIQREL